MVGWKEWDQPSWDNSGLIWFHGKTHPWYQPNCQFTLPFQTIAYGQVPLSPLFYVCLHLFWEGTIHVADIPPSNGSCDACQKVGSSLSPSFVFSWNIKAITSCFFMLNIMKQDVSYHVIVAPWDIYLLTATDILRRIHLGWTWSAVVIWQGQ